MKERILEHHRDIRVMWTNNSAIAEHTYDADHLPSWSGVLCIVYDRHWYTRHVWEAIQIQLYPNTIERNREIDIPESWMSSTSCHTQQTKASTVSARPTTGQPADRLPATEQLQKGQPGPLLLLAQPITELPYAQNQMLHHYLHNQSQSSLPNSTHQIDQS